MSQCKFNTYLVFITAIDVDPKLCMQLLKLQAHSRQASSAAADEANLASHYTTALRMTYSDKGIKSLQSPGVRCSLLG
jgi:hypothetical protein